MRDREDTGVTARLAAGRFRRNRGAGSRHRGIVPVLAVDRAWLSPEPWVMKYLTSSLDRPTIGIAPRRWVRKEARWRGAVTRRVEPRGPLAA
jgi:hypothetical protein